jgi:hypothetical protein
MFGYYFDEQRVFAKPIIKIEKPEMRVEMLKSLLKVTPAHKQQRIRALLAKAQRRVEEGGSLNELCDRGEQVWRNGRSLSYEWQGILRAKAAAEQVHNQSLDEKLEGMDKVDTQGTSQTPLDSPTSSELEALLVAARGQKNK